MSNKAEKCWYGWFPCSSAGTNFLSAPAARTHRWSGAGNDQQIRETLSPELSWSHYCKIIRNSAAELFADNELNGVAVIKHYLTTAGGV